MFSRIRISSPASFSHFCRKESLKLGNNCNEQNQARKNPRRRNQTVDSRPREPEADRGSQYFVLVVEHKGPEARSSLFLVDSCHRYGMARNITTICEQQSSCLVCRVTGKVRTRVAMSS